MDWYAWLSKTRLDPSLVSEYGESFVNNELEKEDIAYFNHEFLQSMGISIAKHRLEILKLAKRDLLHHNNNNNHHKTTTTTTHNVFKHPMSKLLFVLKKTKKSLVNYIASLVHYQQQNPNNDYDNDHHRGLSLVPKKKQKKKKKINEKISKGGVISYSSRWKRAMMMRNNNNTSTRKFVFVNTNTGAYVRKTDNNSNQERLMLTNDDYFGDYLGDDPLVVSTSKFGSFTTTCPLIHDDVQQTMDKKFPDYPEDEDDDDNNNNNNQEDEDDDYWSPDLEEIKWDAMFHDLKPT